MSRTSMGSPTTHRDLWLITPSTAALGGPKSPSGERRRLTFLPQGGGGQRPDGVAIPAATPPPPTPPVLQAGTGDLGPR